MARINSYVVDTSLSGGDILMGSNYIGTTGGVKQYETRSYRLDDLTDFFKSNIAVASVGENGITTTQLHVVSAGDVGQYLTSDGDGTFSWVTLGVGDGGLTEKNFTSALNTKLDGIAAGAEVNVQSDWNSNSGDSQILNKPTIPGGNQVLDWTGDVSGGNIHTGNYTNTTYSVQDGELSENNLTDALKTAYDAAYTHSQAAHAPASARQNVQSDWTANSGDAHILNKPTIAYTSAIPNATTSADGLMSDADKTKLDGLGGSSGEANVQADWDETGTSDDAFIKNKPELGDLDLSAFFAEFTYGSGLLTKIEYWNSSSKNTKYYTKDLTYTSGTLTQSVLTNNISSATQTKVLAYDNSGNLTTITKS